LLSRKSAAAKAKGHRFSFYFNIKLQLDDIKVLHYIKQQKLEVGKIYTHKNTATFRNSWPGCWWVGGLVGRVGLGGLKPTPPTQPTHQPTNLLPGLYEELQKLFNILEIKPLAPFALALVLRQALYRKSKSANTKK
jgi:hypothetical protein